MVRHARIVLAIGILLTATAAGTGIAASGAGSEGTDGSVAGRRAAGEIRAQLDHHH